MATGSCRSRMAGLCTRRGSDGPIPIRRKSGVSGTRGLVSKGVAKRTMGGEEGEGGAEELWARQAVARVPAVAMEAACAGCLSGDAERLFRLKPNTQSGRCRTPAPT